MVAIDLQRLVYTFKWKNRLQYLSQVQQRLHIILVLRLVLSFIDVTCYQVFPINETQMIMRYFPKKRGLKFTMDILNVLFM